LLSKITFRREPAVYIALIGALLVAVVQSGVSPEITANAAGYTTLITLFVGIAIRFFVSPSPYLSTPAAPPAGPPAA
jgi:hypothetical protein